MHRSCPEASIVVESVKHRSASTCAATTNTTNTTNTTTIIRSRPSRTLTWAPRQTQI